MKQKRREFLKASGLAGLSMAGIGLLPAEGKNAATNSSNEAARWASAPKFNMSGYAAPKLETVRIGFIGLGNRGPGAVKRMNKIDGVDIKALCDIRPEKVDAVKKSLEGSGHNPDVYTGKEEEWKKMCERADIDLVYIATPWSMHAPMAVYAMNQGKHVCIEVPAAKTLEEC